MDPKPGQLYIDVHAPSKQVVRVWKVDIFKDGTTIVYVHVLNTNARSMSLCYALEGFKIFYRRATLWERIEWWFRGKR